MKFNNDYPLRVKGSIRNEIFNTLKRQIKETVVDLKIEGFTTKEPVPFKDRLDYKLKNFKPGDSWGELFDCAWFLITGKIENYNKKEDYYLSLDFNGELCLFDNKGTPLKGFTNGSSVFDRGLGEPGKYDYLINDLIKKDGSVSFWVEGGTNDLFGSIQNNARILYAKIIKKDPVKEELFFDLESLFSLLNSNALNEMQQKELLSDLEKISWLIMYDEEDFVKKSLAITKKYYNGKINPNYNVYSIGHAHMDLAWLWPIRETKRKISRTVSTAIDLLEKHPEYIFGISQPQQLEWIKEDYPKLFDKIKELVAKGRIELQGGLWCEPDTNVSGEEALVRQMLYGIRYYLENFNFRVRNVWLPDVFGYSGNMPQIIKKSGLDYFMTIKLSWNLRNVFPYKSFIWEGIDSSSVIAHMPPEGTYNSPALPTSIIKAIEQYDEKEIAPIFLNVFGIGNGGGGPGEEHIERIKRQSYLEGLPKNEFKRADTFFEDLSKYENVLPHYKGELYFENHQGVFTSAPNAKKYNRLLEEALRSLEIYLVLNGNFAKHQAKIDKIWKEVLLYQFHDILPGSSIKRVYEESDKRYKEMLKEIEEIFKQNNAKEIYFNPNIFSQTLTKVENNKVKTYNFEPLSTSSDYIEETFKKIANTEFETKDLKITISKEDGTLTSIFNKLTNTELLNGKGNELLLYRDFGNGWDIPDHYRMQTPKKLSLTKQETFESDSFYLIKNNYKVLNTTIREEVLINKNTNVITFKHETDLKDLGYMLRTKFPVTVESDEATFDIQFGHLNRSRKNENNITLAQYEVPHYKWLFVSDNKNSIGITNKSKYGAYVKDNILDLNLTRSTDYPGKNLGIEKTDYEYSFVILSSDDPISEIDKLSNMQNTYFPLVGKDQNFSNLIKLTNDKLYISAIKGSYDKDGIIIRIVNPNNKSHTTKLELGITFEKIEFTNLVEERINDFNILDEISLSNFEVITLKVYPKNK